MLTPKGILACCAHQRQHEKWDQNVIEYMEGLDQEQIDTIMEFICKMESISDKRP